MGLPQYMSHLVHREKVELRKACWKSVELTKGLWRFRLTLGFVRKSAVSGNSTGNRGVRDDEEPVFSVGGLWLGEVTGLRLGDVPRKEHKNMGIDKGVTLKQSHSSLITYASLGS